MKARLVHAFCMWKPFYSEYLFKMFLHKSAVIHMYRAALSNGHVFLNKAIKIQKVLYAK